MSPNETRGNPYKIVRPRANRTVHLNSFSHRVINNWNNLASEIVCAESVTIFKTKLDQSWICWLRVWEVPGSIPSQGPRHTKDVIKMVPVVPLLGTQH